MSGSFSIGKLFGIELRVHVTFFLLLAWIGLSAALTGGAAEAAASVVLVLALFACVVAHEFGHALMARRFGIRTADVTLLPIGGVARLETMPEAPLQEVAVALAGPAVTLLIWAVLVFGFGASTGAEVLEAAEPGLAGFLDQLAAVNLSLLLFNLLPAFPMDGGRVLRALLTLAVGRARATRFAAAAGQAFALVLGFLGLTWGNPILVLVAVFVYIAASAESSDVALRSVARASLARDAMITQFETLTPADRIDTAAQALIRTTQHEFPVLDADGRLAGFLTRVALLKALALDRRGDPVGEVMATGIPVVRLSDSLEAALDAMRRGGAQAVGVAGSDGAFLGYITPENLGEMMLVARKAV